MTVVYDNGFYYVKQVEDFFVVRSHGDLYAVDCGMRRTYRDARDEADWWKEKGLPKMSGYRVQLLGAVTTEGKEKWTAVGKLLGTMAQAKEMMARLKAAFPRNRYRVRKVVRW